MRSIHGVAPLLPLAVACGHAQSAREPAAVMPAVALPSAAPAPPPGPATLSRPDVACSYHAQPWAPRAGLRVAPQDPSFVRVLRQPDAIDVFLPTGGADAGLFLELARGGVHLRGYLAERRLWAARPLVIGGFLARGDRVQLDALVADARGVTVAHPPIDNFTPTEPLRTRVACDALAPNAGRFDLPQLPAPSAILREGLLVGGAVVPLRVEPGGEIVGTWRVPTIMAPYVRVVATSGDHSRVVVGTGSGSLLFGWIATSAIGEGDVPRSAETE